MAGKARVETVPLEWPLEHEGNVYDKVIIRRRGGGVHGEPAAADTSDLCASAVLSARRPFRCPSAPPELIRDASGARRSCRSTAAQRAHARYPREGARPRAPRYGTESQRPRRPLARNTHGPRTLPALPPMRSSPSTVLPKPPRCARATVSNPIRPRQGNDPYGSRRQPLSVGSELSSLFEALVAATRLRLDLATLPSRLQVRNLARNRYAAAAAECLMLRDERTCRQSCLRTAFDPIQTSFWENGPSQTL